MKEKKEKMCEGCMACDPYSYFIEVDASFLRMVKETLKDFQHIVPDHVAPGWMEQCEEYIMQIEKKYNQKINLF